MTDELSKSLDALAASGLNWVTFVPCPERDALSAVPASSRGQPPPPVPPGCPPQAGYGLLLLLSLGPTFGEHTNYAEAKSLDPFDDRALELTTALLAKHFESSGPAQVLYPGRQVIDLRAWMRVGQVEYPSLLGIGIRPDCGLWFAVRAAAWVRVSPEQRRLLQERYPPLNGVSPCESCSTKPCLDACPVDALRAGAKRLETCVEHRASTGSSCVDRCSSRLACPVGQGYRYPEAQLRYHYGRSLNTIVRWKARQVGSA
jgi:hypothetical protein